LGDARFGFQHNLFRGSENVSSSKTDQFQSHALGAAPLRFSVIFGCQRHTRGEVRESMN
jgi:hypothetical protein